MIIQRVTLGKFARLVGIYISFTLVLLLKNSLRASLLNSQGCVQPQTFTHLEYFHAHENIFGCVLLSPFINHVFTLRFPPSGLKYEISARDCATTPHTGLPLSVSVHDCGR